VISEDRDSSETYEAPTELRSGDASKGDPLVLDNGVALQEVI
jgi:phage portal protein BeeE